MGVPAASPARVMRGLSAGPLWLWADWRRWTAAVYAAIPVCFLLDGWSALPLEWALALLAWLVLLAVGSQLSKTDRILVAALIVSITCGELVLSEILGWYHYRQGHVPAWIPPAHGLVFITALRFSRQPLAARIQGRLLVLTAASLASYALLGYLLRDDAVGALTALLTLSLLGAFAWPRRRFFCLMTWTVCYLEFVGVSLGAWYWEPVMPLLGLPEASPPAGIVGVYSLFDTFALAFAGWWAARSSRAQRSAGRSVTSGPDALHWELEKNGLAERARA